MTVLTDAPVLVAGAGVMGAGIAQVAAQAGHRVFLFDLREGAAVAAKASLARILDGLVAKGRLEAEAAHATLERIAPVAALADAVTARLAIEAIVEQLDAKRALLKEIESTLTEDAVLATNTSSLSVTAMASGLARPQRLVGMHFFNPVPLMKLVEVVSGSRTDPAIADAIAGLARSWNKTAVHVRNTPGFIVNRVARPYYAESLALLHERAAEPAALDACLRAAGFRMGPCELMDLIGHDTSLAVTSSVFAANFFDRRYAPSPVQRELVEAGFLGRKSGRGFYAYPGGPPPIVMPTLAAPSATPVAPSATPVAPSATKVTVHGDGAAADAFEAALSRTHRAGRVRASTWTGLEIDGARLAMTMGLPAHEVARRAAIADIAVFDRLVAPAPGALAYAVNGDASAGWAAQAPAWLRALGFTPVPLADAAGLVVARTVAMLINEAADAVLQGVCSAESVDAAMKLGVNYPAGPFEWLREWGTDGAIAVIEALDAAYRGERYRVSPWLRRGAPATP